MSGAWRGRGAKEGALRTGRKRINDLTLSATEGDNQRGYRWMKSLARYRGGGPHHVPTSEGMVAIGKKL